MYSGSSYTLQVSVCTEVRHRLSLTSAANMDSKFMKLMNVRVLNESANKAVVLGHGFGLDQSVWRHMLPGLTGNGFKVVLLDWPFSGAVDPVHFCPDRHVSFSGYVDDLLALLDELKIERCSFVGHSMSGMVGCLASVKKPEIFEKLVLLCASPRYLNDESFTGGFSRADVDGLYAAVENNFAGWVAAFAPLVVGVKDDPAVEEFTSKMLKMDPNNALSVAKMIFESDTRNLLSQVKTPCSVIQTRNDAAVPLSVAYYIHNNLGCARGAAALEILESEGHLPQLTSPASLSRALQIALQEEAAQLSCVCNDQHAAVAVQT